MLSGREGENKGEERQGTLTRACRLFHSVENYNEQIWKKVSLVEDAQLYS